MIAHVTIKYFKRDIWFLDDAKNSMPKNQEVELIITKGRYIQLIERTEDSILICDFCPWETFIHPVLCNELHYLAKNQRGIFRLLFMFLESNMYVCQVMRNLANLYEIQL